MVIKLVYGLGFGIIFILVSGFFYGGILFSDFLPSSSSNSYFIILGFPYGFISAIVYAIFLKLKKVSENVVKKSLVFGAGFWLSFATLYLIGYLAFSNFGF